ncbi:hypothetical protein E1B28_006790 [Marasmius oreades]|uniref:Uncharacterized protein n=1 Tax=Marasmius oreades TaxID=181124 RepID=A0A9P8AA48_9AGAR|nr:uncharacterized protein E1B28_006790 [Marasmius oreades]KAG7096116.1 hypothetical protein E1B28_006790 [Marasmius oreades]
MSLGHRKLFQTPHHRCYHLCRCRRPGTIASPRARFCDRKGQKVQTTGPIRGAFTHMGLILFIFGVTTGSVNGWNTARCLAPLIISFFLISAFFLWEARLPEDMATIPPNLWNYTNFAVLVLCGTTIPFNWWGCVQLLFSWIWQDVYGWTPIQVALRFLPLGVLGFPVIAIANVMQQKLPLKWVIFAGQVIGIVGTVLLPFADSPQHYWRFAFPGFVLGTTGMTIIFATVNIAVFAVTPPEKAGVVGSIIIL